MSETDEKFHELEPIKPVLCLKSTIVKTEILKSGDRVSYNGIYRANKPIRIATLPLGYYEGVPRQLSNLGSFITGDKTNLPILGRVCMNHTMINIDMRPDLKVGNEITVISMDNEDINSIRNLSKIDGLFSYSLMTGLSESTRRIITN